MSTQVCDLEEHQIRSESAIARDSRKESEHRKAESQAPQTGVDTSSVADSGYCSMADPSSSGTEMHILKKPDNPFRRAETKGKQIPGTEYRMFRRPGVSAAEQHYQIAVSPITDFLKQHLINAQKDPSSTMIVRPGIIGKTEDEATLHIVVICEPELESTIHSFFTQFHIAALLCLPNGGNLGYFVIPKTPRLRSAELDIQVFCQDDLNLTRSTYCGAPITLSNTSHALTRSEARRATFGGIIKVVYGNGETKFFGITAGHAVEDALRHAEEVDKSATSSSELERPQGDHFSSQSTALGRILDYKQLPGIAAERVKQTHDWALFEVDNTLPNAAKALEHSPGGNQPHAIIKAARPACQDGYSDPVLLMSESDKARCGELSEIPARVWVSHSSGFVDCYVLDLEEGEICDGDSGAWVVHSAAPELYGHLTATDLFGSAYVVPALDAFDNIRDCLGAVSVTLPVTGDVTQAKANRSYKVDDEICSHTRAAQDTQKAGAKLEALLPPPQAGKYIPIMPAGSSEIPSEKHIPRTRGFARTRWSTSFAEQNRPQRDIPWAEGIVSKDEGDPIKLFMSYYEAEHSEDDQVKAVVDFCKDATNLGVGERRAWLVDHEDYPNSIKTHQPYRKLLTAAQLREELNSKRFGHSELPDAHRRLIYIRDIDPEYLLALATTADTYQVDALRSMFCKHVSAQCALSTTLLTPLSPGFNLQFHMPYFAWGHRKSTTDNKQKGSSRLPRREIDLRFLEKGTSLDDTSDTIYEAHISFLIIGTGERRWTAFSFADTYFDSNSEDFGDEFLTNDAESPDLILSDHSDANGSIWDARLYFLMTVKFRMENILKEWEDIVQSVKRGIKDNEEQGARNFSHKPQGDCDFLYSTDSLIVRLQSILARTLDAWNRFDTPHGDISNLCNLSVDTRDHLDAIRRHFKSLEDLQQTLSILGQKVVARIQFHSFWLGQQSLKVAERTSRATLWMNLVIAPVIIVSSIFAMPTTTLAFNRESLVYFLSLFVAMVVLAVLSEVFQFLPLLLPWAKNRMWHPGTILTAMRKRLRGVRPPQPYGTSEPFPGDSFPRRNFDPEVAFVRPSPPTSYL